MTFCMKYVTLRYTFDEPICYAFCDDTKNNDIFQWKKKNEKKH